MKKETSLICDVPFAAGIGGVVALMLVLVESGWFTDSFDDFVCRIVVSLLPTASTTHSVGTRLLVSLGVASCVSFPNHTMWHCRLLIVARNDSCKVVGPCLS